MRKLSAAPEPDPTAAYAGPSRGSHLGMGEAAGEGTGTGDAARVSKGDSSNPVLESRDISHAAQPGSCFLFLPRRARGIPSALVLESRDISHAAQPGSHFLFVLW